MEMIIGMIVIVEIEVEVILEKGHFQETIAIIEGMIEMQAIVDQRSGSRACTNRDRIRCYTSREYDHFTKDCPASKVERVREQIQQMFSLEDQTSLKALATDTYDSLNKINPI